MSLQAATVLTEVKAFLHQAGTLGLSIQQTAERSEKADSSIVTEADLAISALFQKAFQHYLSQPGHVLIDEETEKAGGPAEVLAADYQWVIDPIDGTASYAGNSLFWGIIVSVFRKGEPWLAGVYMPAMGLLYWADETTAYETSHAFSGNESTRQLAPVDMPFTNSSQIAIHFDHAQDVFQTKPCILVDYWGPIVGAFTVAGRLRGYVFRDSVWDFGAAFVFAARVGYKVRRLADGKVMTKLDAELLSPGWKTMNDMIIAPDNIYEGLKPHLKAGLSIKSSNSLQLAV